MGVFSYFRRRRERESSIPSIEPMTAKLSGGGTPIGQPMQATPQSGFPLDLGGGFGGLASIGSAFSMVSQGSQLRDEIFAVMRQHGIDPQSGQTENVDAADYSGMQEQILEVLARHGIDVSAMGAGGIEIEGSSADDA